MPRVYRQDDSVPTIRATRILDERFVGEDVVFMLDAYLLVNGVYLPMPRPMRLLRPLEDVRDYRETRARVFDAPAPRPVVTLQ